MISKYAVYAQTSVAFCTSMVFQFSLEDTTAVSATSFFEKYRNKVRFVNIQSRKVIDWNSRFELDQKYTIVGHMLGLRLEQSRAFARLNGASFSRKEITIFIMALVEEGRLGRPNALCDWLFSNFSRSDYQVYYLRMEEEGVVRIDLNFDRHMFDIDFFFDTPHDDILPERVVLFSTENDFSRRIAA